MAGNFNYFGLIITSVALAKLEKLTGSLHSLPVDINNRDDKDQDYKNKCRKRRANEIIVKRIRRTKFCPAYQDSFLGFFRRK